jgi:hypothetical protein
MGIVDAGGNWPGGQRARVAALAPGAVADGQAGRPRLVSLICAGWLPHDR